MVIKEIPDHIATTYSSYQKRIIFINGNSYLPGLKRWFDVIFRIVNFAGVQKLWEINIMTC